jgi:hypothetical protein
MGVLVWIKVFDSMQVSEIAPFYVWQILVKCQRETDPRVRQSTSKHPIFL